MELYQYYLENFVYQIDNKLKGWLNIDISSIPYCSIKTHFLPRIILRPVFCASGKTLGLKLIRYIVISDIFRDVNLNFLVCSLGSSLFSDFQCLSRIWSHPWSLHLQRMRQIQRQRPQSDDSMDEFVNDESADELSEECEDDKKESLGCRY